MQAEDPIKQINYLQQCLSSDKRPLSFFLGAGCPSGIKDASSSAPLIPDINGISKVVSERLLLDPTFKPSFEKIQDHFKKDGIDNPTVEDALSHIRALRAVAGKDSVRGLSSSELDSLDDKICQLIHELADKSLPDFETPYHNLAAWVDAIRREGGVEIFTTNYDLLMEQALEAIRVPYFDGFPGVQRPLFDLRTIEEDSLPPRWARLWKIHGSINWYQAKEKGVFRGTTNEQGNVRRVIHPSHLKYQESRRMPYLAIIDRLRTFFKQPAATLFICGYSFRDDHINEIIVQGLLSAPTAIAFAILHSNIDKYPYATKLAEACPNLSVLARDAAIISGKEAHWVEKDTHSVSSSSSPWIKWTPKDSTKPDGPSTSELLLGDFFHFGLFLKELTGAARESAGVRNA